MRDISAVAADLAIQQENEGLRLALREQERIVEELTNECRRLEDRLEDRYQDIDALRRELDRGERALKQAEERSSQLTPGERGATDNKPAADSPGEASSAESLSSPRSRSRLPGFGVGLLSGLVLMGIGLAGLWGAGILTLGRVPSAQPQMAAPAEMTQTQPPEPEPEPETESALSEPIPPEPIVQDAPQDVPQDVPQDLQIPQQRVAGTHADPLRDTTATGPEMIVLNPSDFMMGNPLGMADSDARPVHKVSLEGFMIGAREVTFADYDRFVRDTGARRPLDHGWGRGARPVIDVTWDEALAYTQWLSEQTGQPYRLPSEAEWEYAARGGTTSSYWWGVGSPASRALCMDCGTRWDQRSTAPVGSFPPNPLGLFDTAGNVYEWIADCYHHNYTGAPGDGRAWVKPDCEFRVARGGGFKSPASSMRSHARNRFATHARVDMLGFRVARDLNPRENDH
jgi:formylglycine-generating enzyme required for sulfatase activity